MAWYTINYTCGHSDREQLYGKETERQKHIAWAERNKMCPQCYRAEQDRQRATALETAKAESSGLPTLAGSEKQIAWAMTIRAAAKAKLETAVGLYSKAWSDRPEARTAEHPAPEDVAAFAARVLRQTEAKYWIDNRLKFASAEIACQYCVKRTIEIGAASVGRNLINPTPPVGRHVAPNQTEAK